MALTTTPTLNRHMFVSEFCRLTFAGVTESELSIFVVLNGDTVLSNTYIPDSRGEVTIYDIDLILEPLIDNVYADVIFIVNGSALAPQPVTVFRCTAAMPESAQSFITDFFLTSSMAERDTFPGRYECLTAFCPEEETATAECTYLCDDGTLGVSTFELTKGRGLISLDVSPAKFCGEETRLISYVVRCGRRKAMFRVLSYVPDTSAAFIFRNNFGAWETLYLTGQRETSPAYTRSHAYLDGRYRPYRIEEVISYKCATGPMRPGLVPVAMDMARATEVFALNADGTAGAELTVTDCDTKHTDADNDIPDFTFTYRLADRRNAAIEVKRPPRLFDNTFDNTYE